MASSGTKSKKSKKKKSGVSKKRREELKQQSDQFNKDREQKASEQALTSDRAVPEQRPQAFAESRPDLESDQRKMREERGDLEPMPMSAHVKAASGAQLEKAEGEEEVLGPETLREGARVRIIKGDFKGSEGAVVEVTYDGHEEAMKAKSGDPSVARFARAAEYMVRTRGSSNALVPLKPNEVEPIDQLTGVNDRGA